MENLKLFKRVIVLQSYKPLLAETAKQLSLNLTLSIVDVFYFFPNIVEQILRETYIINDIINIRGICYRVDFKRSPTRYQQVFLSVIGKWKWEILFSKSRYSKFIYPKLGLTDYVPVLLDLYTIYSK
jgi:hypothetical protein